VTSSKIGFSCIPTTSFVLVRHYTTHFPYSRTTICAKLICRTRAVQQRHGILEPYAHTQKAPVRSRQRYSDMKGFFSGALCVSSKRRWKGVQDTMRMVSELNSVVAPTRRRVLSVPVHAASRRPHGFDDFKSFAFDVDNSHTTATLHRMRT
jgi:hypothetical protein